MKVLENTTIEGESPVIEYSCPTLDNVPKLVVVANIQARNLKAEVEKGSPTPVFGWGSVDPKAPANAVFH
jgi:hypothetical protein